MLVSIAVIPIMASLNAPSLSTKIGSIRPKPNSPRMEAVVEAEVDAAAEVALLVEAVAMVVIEPTPAESGRAMMLRCLQRLPQMVALENITENGAWFANLAGGTPHIPLDIMTHVLLILSPFPFLPLIFIWSKSGKTPPEGGGGGSVIPTMATTKTAASITSLSSLSSRVGPLNLLHSTRPIPRKDNLFLSLLTLKGR